MNSKAVIAGAFALGVMPVLASAESDGKFTRHFPIGNCEFETRNFEAEEANRFFILKPGRELHYNNFACVAAGECDEVEELVITVLNRTRDVTFQVGGREKTVTTRVVRERETADGQLVEISYNFFAQCDDNQDVYYFGERVDIYEDGQIVSHDGAWLAGRNGARPGIIFPGGAFLLGARYFQELAPGVALDRAEHVAMGLEVDVPAGNFKNCVDIDETTPLEPGDLSEKTYCPGKGLVFDNELELIAIVE